MSQVGGDILIVLLLIIANGLFSMFETAVISARKSRLQDWIKLGNRRAKTALEIADAPNRVLTAVQIGITLIGIVAGVFSSGAIAEALSGSFAFTSSYSQPAGLAFAILIVACLLLVLGEFVPKRLAARHPDRIAIYGAGPLKLFAQILSPLVVFLNTITDMICRLFGKKPAEPSVTEEEIKTLVQQGTEAGVFEETEQDMVEAVLRLGDKPARAIMTPRTQIAWLDIESDARQVQKTIAESGRSRFPLAQGTLDKVTGVVPAKELLVQILSGQPLNLSAVTQQPLFVPRTISALELLDSFKKNNKHLALVVDEYGGIEGLLTHHDILQAIAGDFPTSARPNDPKAVQRHDGSWLLDGMLSVDEFRELFHLETLPGEKRDAYQTLGGFVFTQMGRVPSVAESFEWSGLRFEIVDMDGKRIDKVLVSRSEKQDDSKAPTSSET